MSWFVVNTRVNSERLSKANLERQGYQVFLPSFRKTVRHARQSREVLAPLFPSYIFVEFDPEWTRWRPINATAGVRAIVTGSDGRPSPVPVPVMRALLDRCPDGLFAMSADTVAVGDRVRITAGPFVDLMGQIQRLDGPGRVRLLLDALAGVPITVPVGALRSLEHPPLRQGVAQQSVSAAKSAGSAVSTFRG